MSTANNLSDLKAAQGGGGGGTLTDHVNAILALSDFASEDEVLILDDRGVAGAVIFPGTTLAGEISILNDDALLSFTAANLATCTGALDLTGCTALVTLDLSALTTDIPLNVSGCTALVTVDLSSVTTQANAIDLSGFTSLVTLDLSALVIPYFPIDLSGCTSLVTLNISSITQNDVIDLSGCTSLTALDLSSLSTQGGALFDLSGCTSLVTLDLSALTNQYGTFNISGCTSLAALDLSSLTTQAGTLNLSGCTSLVALTFPASVASDSTFALNASGCALNTASVNGILSAYAAGIGAVTSGTINLSGVANASPTGGVANAGYVTLTGAGITVLLSLPEITQISAGSLTGADFVTAGEGKYFLISDADERYAVWFNTGTETEPDAGDVIYVEATIDVAHPASVIEATISVALQGAGAALTSDFEDHPLVITDDANGTREDAADIDTGLSITVTQQGG